MRKRIIYVIIIVVLLLTGCTIGGSFYMLNFSLTPDAKILSKDADSYPFMYRNYPFLRPWVDSLKQVDALKDTFIINPHGIQLHACVNRARHDPEGCDGAGFNPGKRTYYKEDI